MSLTRSRKVNFILNTVVPLIAQIITIASGFIVPQLILNVYGSTVNGLINSITQFLSVISLLDLGMGAVVSTALYRPLAEKNTDEISKIYVSATKFSRRLAMILALYVVVLVFIYPRYINQSFGTIYTAILIIAIGINSFSQYYFGYVNGLLLSADQKAYIRYASITLTQIINLFVCVILIQNGSSIQLVKFATSLIYIIRPVILSIYVKHNYTINKKIKYTIEPIKQKWNGVAQHLAYYVLTSTDSIVLTVFSTLENVSIYSVYNIVVSNIKALLSSTITGIQPLMGDMLAKKEKKKLYDFFSFVEWGYHTGITLIFGCTASLLLYFVMVYTNGVTDANYYQPIFAILITLANALDFLKQPYNNLVLAAGHYKQTQHIYIFAMIINIVISIAFVNIWGLIGVSIGTIVAMLFQATSLAWYNSQNIIHWPFRNYLKGILIDVIVFILGYSFTKSFQLIELSYLAWASLAVKVFFTWLIITMIINILFNRKNMVILFKVFYNKLIKYKKKN